MPTPFRTGKLTPRADERTLRFARFIAASELPDPPSALSYADRVQPWPMYANDKLGDCTCAAAAHMIELWAKLEGQDARPAHNTVIKTYRQLSPQDEGCVMLDVLRYWRKSGIGAHQLYAFAALDLRNTEHVKLGVSMFGGVYLGLALPLSAQEQTGPGKVWDIPHGGLHGLGKRNGWGGHAVNVVGYDARGLEVVTWGQVQRMSWAFWATYADEAWVALTKDWKETPKGSGIDFPALKDALGRLGKVTA